MNQRAPKTPTYYHTPAVPSILKSPRDLRAMCDNLNGEGKKEEERSVRGRKMFVPLARYIGFSRAIACHHDVTPSRSASREPPSLFVSAYSRRSRTTREAFPRVTTRAHHPSWVHHHHRTRSTREGKSATDIGCVIISRAGKREKGRGKKR